MAIDVPILPGALPDDPCCSAAPMRGAAEVAMHGAMQALFAERMRSVVSDRIYRPRGVWFDAAGYIVIRRWLVEWSREATHAAAFVGCWSPAALTGVHFRLRTWTVANPPVLITTGPAVVMDAPAARALGPSELLERGIPESYWNVKTGLSIALDLSGTREQLVTLDGGFEAGTSLWEVDLQGVELWECRRSQIG